ncbi:nitroreductase family protein [Thermaurantiacus sp.]
MAGLRHLLRRARSLVRAPKALAAFLYDYRQFARASGAIRARDSVRTEEARLVKAYHRIEKGLALPEPRIGFGRQVVEEVLQRIQSLGERDDERDDGGFQTAAARASLLAYRAAEVCLPETADRIERVLAGLPAHGPAPLAGAKWVTRDEIRAASAIDFGAFVRGRYSVRDFTGEAVPPEVVRDAVAIAMKSPRVCNRGTAMCHAIFDPELMRRALSFQNGNSGFGHLAGAVLILTADRRGFLDIGERNQCWVDGGLFAMTLVYALHAAGYGTCMLNWSATPDRDRRLRAALDLPEELAIVTLMAVGGLKDRFRVAVSPREPVKTAFRVLGPVPAQRGAVAAAPGQTEASDVAG